ncbi:hypothetical protein A9Q84_07795 [Halobacteriovorax marinus]|uniref:Tyr recombinase domain-containing protein n=1 Tax=Halobacteriovorax marinus TaxID=97084 RepID=A0A1Y5F9S0_9BACT|nr:hypothetical protein A9Q84_07795 [Halobacteriovorax marinus]
MSYFIRQRVTVRRPTGSRKSFKLILDRTDIEGKRTQPTIDSPELTRINHGLNSDEFDYNHALYLVDKLKKKMQIKYKIANNEQGEVSNVNMRMFKKFWQERYEHKDNLKTTTKITARHKFIRVLRLLGSESLLTVDIETAKKLIDKDTSTPNAYNGVIKDFNQLMKHLNRDYTLSKKRVRKREPVAINEEQLTLLLSTLKTQFDRDAVTVMYYSGIRTGELFALNEECYRGETRLFISEQMMRDFSYDDPKNGKRRTTIVYPKGLEALDRWVYNYSLSLKQENREALSKRVVEASLKAFQGRLKATISGTNRKNISNHIMRHSFAKMCLNKGLSISDIAMLIGDSVDVAQENYIGWILENDALQRIEDKLNMV